MSVSERRIALGVVLGTIWASSWCYGATPVKLSGSIVGLVSDNAGVPQMGATVLLYNRFEKLLERTLTTDKGSFAFDALLPDVYAVRVTLSSFLPALRRNIIVQPGMQSLLNVNLAHVFSTIELVAVAPGNGPLMSDEWKWVLRSSSSTRPILRFLPDFDGRSDASLRRPPSSLFSDTRGLLRVSAGDQASFLDSEPDLGTAFAVATSFLGKNQLQVAGNIGYASASGIPTAAFRTSFRREIGEGMSPEVKLTMRQLFLPSRVGAALFGGMPDNVPVMRSLSAGFRDEAQLADHVRLEYGFSLDSVSFLERLNYFSPYGRLTYDRGNGETIQAAYVSGTPAPELFAEGESDLELQQDVSALAMFPRVSLRSGVARVQRSQSYEIGYSKKEGSKTFSVGAYTEDVSNAAVSMVSADGLQAGADLLPDLFSDSFIFNAGHYHSAGYLVSLTQDLGEHLDATVAYGSGNALTADGDAAEVGTPDDLRSVIRNRRRHSLTMRVSGSVPKTGTQFVTSYQWASLASLTPAHMYLTQRMREGLGLNVRVRQPIPYFGGLPGHVEATAEMRNLLAQGYVPLLAGGRRVCLMHTPRLVRGGLSFTF